MDEPRFLLVDGHGLAYRAFYALPELTAPDGTPVNAVLGFLNMLQKVLEERRPEGWGLFFDPKGPTARKEMYDAYKEGRRPTPEAFKVQLPLLLELLEALGHRVTLRPGVEADDGIAATASALAAEGDVLVLSADKDLLQVLAPGVRVCRPQKGVSEFRIYDEALFREEYGFAPQAMADYLALTGDSVDHIPGVPGIGDKGARGLLARYGDLEGIYAHLEELPKGQRGKLEAGRDQAFRSRELVVPLPTEPVPAEGLLPGDRDVPRARDLCARLGLRQLSRRLGLEEESREPLSSPGPEVSASATGEAADLSLEEALESPDWGCSAGSRGTTPSTPGWNGWLWCAPTGLAGWVHLRRTWRNGFGGRNGFTGGTRNGAPSSGRRGTPWWRT